jgi:hypothetical protein
MKRTLCGLSLVAVVAVWAACSPIQTVSYPVREPDGRTTNVDKYFSSLTTDDPGDRAFKQIQAGRTDEALATMKGALASSPTDSSFHYDLAIIYEIKADWPSALAEIREAKRLVPTDKMYSDEETFIAQHQKK